MIKSKKTIKRIESHFKKKIRLVELFPEEEYCNPEKCDFVRTESDDGTQVTFFFSPPAKSRLRGVRLYSLDFMHSWWNDFHWKYPSCHHLMFGKLNRYAAQKDIEGREKLKAKFEGRAWPNCNIV